MSTNAPRNGLINLALDRLSKANNPTSQQGVRFERLRSDLQFWLVAKVNLDLNKAVA